MKNTLAHTFFWALLIISIASCRTNKERGTNVSGISKNTNDTLRISNDSLEYEIIIIEPGFNGWLATQRPRGFYNQTFLENKNRLFVSQYNQRVNNPLQFNRNLYLQKINYEFHQDYGYEVNYLLYNYFIFFQQRFNETFLGGRKHFK